MKILWILVCLLFSIALIACSGARSDGGVANDPDTMTVTVSGPSGIKTTTYTETDDSFNSQGDPDPLLHSYLTASLSTRILLRSGSRKRDLMLLSMSVYGDTPQVYTICGLTSRGHVDYAISGYENEHYAASMSTDACGTITLLQVGNVGEKITGEFDVVVSRTPDAAETRGLSGTFSVTREY